MTKIIHQIFIDIGLKPYDERLDYQRNVAINKKMNPDYDHKLWTDDSIEKLIVEQPEPIKVIWNDFPDPFYKIDFARYLILQKYGGIYIDLDVICKIPLSSITEQWGVSVPEIVGAWCHPETNKWEINNNVISLRPELYPKLIEYAMEQYYDKKDMKVYKTWKKRLFLQTVGCRMFKRFIKKYQVKNKLPFDIMFQDQEGGAWVNRKFQ